MDAEALGEKLRSLRARRGLTQQFVAASVGVSPQAVSKWERGENAPDLFLMPTLAAVLNTSIDSLLEYERRTLRSIEGTVFFSGLSGYTAASEKVSPEEMALSLNSHFTAVTECVVQHSGLPIKYMGDAFLAVFVAGDHTRNALDAALCARTVSHHPVTIGVATGPFFMGPVGHPDYARPDVIGDTVNLAARIHGWAGGNTKSGIAATREVVSPWRDRFRVGGPTQVQMKGMSAPVTVCEIVGLVGSANAEE